MQTIHIAAYSAVRGLQLLAIAKVSGADIEYGGGVKDKVAETLLSTVLPSVDPERVESLVFTYLDDNGIPHTEEDFLFYLEPGCCARQSMWVDRVHIYRMQLRSIQSVRVIDLTAAAA